MTNDENSMNYSKLQNTTVLEFSTEKGFIYGLRDYLFYFYGSSEDKVRLCFFIRKNYFWSRQRHYDYEAENVFNIIKERFFSGLLDKDILQFYEHLFSIAPNFLAYYIRQYNNLVSDFLTYGESRTKKYIEFWKLDPNDKPKLFPCTKKISQEL